ncbi:MAG: PadR family transcriptional regulator [Gemmatimonadales bacterium]
MTTSSTIAALLPLKPVELEILLALATEERHGYGLVQAIAERTDGLVQLEPGNLYRVIKRLLAEGMVAESDRRAVVEGSERRRYYRLTALGARVVRADLHRMRALLASSPARALNRRFGTS